MLLLCWLQALLYTPQTCLLFFFNSCSREGFLCNWICRRILGPQNKRKGLKNEQKQSHFKSVIKRKYRDNGKKKDMMWPK